MSSRKFYLWVIAALFLIWSGLFIRRSSVVSNIDGIRRYCLFEDAMISMRYAWNLSHGKGLVWNEGERVEGFTNMLMTLYMSLATAIFDKSNAAFFIQLSGIIFMLVIAYFNMLIAKEIFPENSEFLYVLSYAVAYCYYPLSYWSLMGTEMGLLTMLLISMTWLVIRSGDRLKIMPLLPVLMGLAYLTRPDALIPISLIMAYRMHAIIRQEGGGRVWLAEASILSVFIAALTVFRWSYYGSIVPNTVVLKMTGLPLLDRFRDGIGFTSLYLKSISIPLIISLAAVFLNFSKKKLLLASLILSSIIYQICIGGDAWPYWRFLSPYMPLLFILCFDGLLCLTHRFIKNDVYISGVRISRSQWRKVALSIVTLIILVQVNADFLDEISLFQLPYKVSINLMKVDVALALNEITGPYASVAVISAGAMPYYTDLRAIDMLGRTDKYIARLPPRIYDKVVWSGMRSPPGHNKHDLDYSIIALEPTYVSKFYYGEDNVSCYAKENYRMVRYKNVYLWLLKDSEDVFWEKVQDVDTFDSP